MTAEQEQVIFEYDALQDKILGLYQAHTTPQFEVLSMDEQDRRARQYTAMCVYRNILQERISAFTN